MRTFKALSLALLLGALPAVLPAVITAAHAQVTEIDAEAAMSSIMSAGSRASKVPGIKKVPSVGVIRLDMTIRPMMYSGDIPTRQEFKIMAQKNAAGVAKLQRALAANPVTRDALAKRNVNPGQVAGVQISSNGSLRLYIFSKWDNRP